EPRRPQEPAGGDSRRRRGGARQARLARAWPRGGVREGSLMATAGVPVAGADERRLREEIARFCRVTWDRGLVSAAGGNISGRVGASDTFLITPSGVALRDTEPEDLVTIDLGGRKVAGPERYVPSKESLMHTAVYAARPAAPAVARCSRPATLPTSPSTRRRSRSPMPPCRGGGASSTSRCPTRPACTSTRTIPCRASRRSAGSSPGTSAISPCSSWDPTPAP